MEVNLLNAKEWCCKKEMIAVYLENPIMMLPFQTLRDL